jgi:septum formation protein
MDLILASTSVYRKNLLQRLGIAFDCHAPGCDETALAGEAAPQLAGRLALLKARAVANRFPGALVVGSDQVASIDGSIIGKPGDYERASAQLHASSGREVRFYTGIALCSIHQALERCHVEPFGVVFRTLSATEIDNYLQREQPYDCAGSFKCEALGITLFSRMVGDDPTSLEGLPLIHLASMLREAGMDPLATGITSNDTR